MGGHPAASLLARAGALKLSATALQDPPRFRGYGSMFARGTGEVDGAGAVGAELAVPTVAITRDPSVDSGSQPADARKEQNPTEVAPARQEQSDAGPRFGATEEVSARVDGLHQPHGESSVDLREAFLRKGVLELQEFDAATSIEALHGSYAGAAEAAGTVVKDKQVRRRLRPCGHLKL
jgi:hypothetical protein